MNKNILQIKRRWQRWPVLLLLLGLFVLLVAGASGAGGETAVIQNVQPQLLTLAAEQPNTPVRVIVQKAGMDVGIADAITQLGGTVIRDLKLINATVAQIPAYEVATLAQESGVAWISMDGPVASTSGDFQTVRDEFNTAAYNNNDGTVNWSSNWQEIAESDGPSTGEIEVEVEPACFDGKCLNVETDAHLGEAARRQVDLSMASSAILTFVYANDSGGGVIELQVSSDGGTTWHTLEVYDLNSASGFHNASYDLSPYTAVNTQIQFIVTAVDDGLLGIDNIQIEYTLGSRNVRDEFNTVSFSNNDGIDTWTSDWQEMGESDGPVYGDLQIDQYRLLLTDDNNSVTRLVDLSGVATAELSFDYMRTSLDDSSDYITLELSGDGGTTWVEIDRFVGPATDYELRPISYDITAFASANTAVRFATSATMGDWDFLDIDNLQIEYAFAAPTIDPPVDPTDDPTDDPVDDSNPDPAALYLATVRDAFANETYNNNDGSFPWSTQWVEFGDDGDPTGGKVKIDTGQLRLEDKSRGVQRTVDLSGTATATLEFLYRRDGMDKVEKFVIVEVSTDGGSSWSQLGVIAGPTKDDNLQLISYDLTPYRSAATTIRFRTSADMGGKLWVDNVSIEFSHDGSVGSLVNKLPPDVVRFTTWAAAIGIAENMGFADAQNMIDENGLGPDGLFGLGAGNVKGSFAGFEAQVSPDQRITKVEAVLYGYVPTAIPDEELKLRFFNAGNKLVEVKVPSDVLNWHIGVENAGPVIIDLTADRSWQWADFYNNVELFLEQPGFGGDDHAYYDAVGLRVTSEPGFDPTGDYVQPMDDLPKEAIDVANLLNPFPLAVNAAQVWNEGPAYLQGDDITIAVIDSGIGKTDDLKGRTVKNVNFNQSEHDSTDKYGHGTIVASIIAADGKKSGGQSIGIAPQSRLLNVRVSDDQGMSYESDVVAALEWVFENQDKYNIRVVNLSLNATMPQSYHDSPLNAAVEILWFNGIVVVVSAGNEGTGAIYAPANDPFVITVGATDDNHTASLADDTIATFSAYSVTQDGFAKPDLVAPGRDFITYVPRNEKLTIGEKHEDNSISKDYFRMSGTSLSAPIVSGAVALLLQDEPHLTPDQVKYRLMATANQDWPGYDPLMAGAGTLDVYAAIHGTTTESANQDVMPHMMLAKMALIAYWANHEGGDVTNWDSVNWASVDWDNVDWASVNWASVNWASVNWASVNWASVNWASVNWASVNWASVNWASVNWASVNWASVNWGSVNWGSDSWED